MIQKPRKPQQTFTQLRGPICHTPVEATKSKNPALQLSTLPLKHWERSVHRWTQAIELGKVTTSRAQEGQLAITCSYATHCAAAMQHDGLACNGAPAASTHEFAMLRPMDGSSRQRNFQKSHQSLDDNWSLSNSSIVLSQLYEGVAMSLSFPKPSDTGRKHRS